MGKQTKSKKPNSLGKGQVTDIQIAFIVDRYLSDNNFSETRSVFRTEASLLISKSPVREAPKSLLSLGAMLNEYVCLKEQKVVLDQERARLEQEKLRVQTLLQGMQGVMNAYNASGNSSATPVIQTSATRPPVAVPPQPDPSSGPPAGCPMYKSPTVAPISTLSNTIMEHGNLSSSANHPLTRKRTGSTAAAEVTPAAKKSCSKVLPKKMIGKGTHKQYDNAATPQENAQAASVIGLSPHNHTLSGTLVQGSSVAKSLFNQPLPSPPTSSSGPNTPPQAACTQNDKSITPVGIPSNAHCRNNYTPQEITPTNCTVITSERVTVSPCKHMAYYTMERNHCISSSSPVKTTVKRLSKRDYVKGRLDFDGSDMTVNLDKPVVDEIPTSESDKDGDIFDMDLPNLDVFGANFSFSELLSDLDLGYEGIGCPCQPTLVTSSADTFSGSSHESRDGNLGADQVISEFSSTMTEVISEKDEHIQGLDTLTTVKSITKSIRILSPAKNHRSSLDQENCLARN